jgi:pimeloyl-ACP methyl ester carboxylesterase
MSKINFFLSKNKEKIRYKLIQGKKPVTIIFLHGFMSDLTGKKIQVLSKLSKKEQVSFLALEYTGHGKSSGQLSDYGIDDWINQSKELIEKVVKTKKIILVGSSMGAWIGIALISKLKKIVKGFVGIASAPDFTKEIMWKNFSKKTKSMIKSGKNLLYAKLLWKPLSYIQKINIR